MDDKPCCARCQLFNSKKKLCSVIILHEGQKMNLPVEASDTCFFEQEFKAIDREKMKVERFKPEVQQVKIWVEDPKTGEKCKEGVVKIEYPDGFFGDFNLPDLLAR